MSDGTSKIVFCVDSRGQYSGVSGTLILLGRTEDDIHLGRDLNRDGLKNAMYFIRSQTGKDVVTTREVSSMLEVKGRGDVQYPCGLGTGAMQVSLYNSSIPENERVVIPGRTGRIRSGNNGAV